MRSDMGQLATSRRGQESMLRRLLYAIQTGAFINTMWGEQDTMLANFQMLMIRLTMIWPLKVVTPIAYGYWLNRLSRALRGVPPPARETATTWRGLLRVTAKWAARECLSFWLATEVFFFLYYVYKRRRLQERAHPPRLKKGVPLDILQRTLNATTDIQASVHLLDQPAGEEAVAMRRSMSRAGSRNALSMSRRPSLSPKTSQQDLQQLLHPMKKESNVEELLREWDSAGIAGWSQAASEVHVSDTDRTAIEKLLNKAELTALKHAEISGWFLNKAWDGRGDERWPATNIEQICQGNIMEWLAWAFYHCEPDEVPEDRKEEFQQLLDKSMSWSEVDFPPGYNKDAHAMRLTMDPIPSEHRPLMYYIVTALAMPIISDRNLTKLGFSRHKSGTLNYWRRPGDKTSEGRPEVPLVFCHGVGINLLAYEPFIYEMLNFASDRTIFLVSCPHISMRIHEDVPSAAEMVACLSDMLASWNVPSGHFIGHSFGSVLVGWMCKRAPAFVSFASFMDPICFLLIKPDVCFNFNYRVAKTPTQLLIAYFVARELYIAHSLSRNFFWYQNLVWPEDLSMPALVVLSGEDSLVPAHSIRRYLMAYKHKHQVSSPRLLWFPKLGHGEINFGPIGVEACKKIMNEVLLLESSSQPEVVKGSA